MWSRLRMGKRFCFVFFLNWQKDYKRKEDPPVGILWCVCWLVSWLTSKTLKEWGLSQSWLPCDWNNNEHVATCFHPITIWWQTELCENGRGGVGGVAMHVWEQVSKENLQGPMFTLSVMKRSHRVSQSVIYVTALCVVVSLQLCRFIKEKLWFYQIHVKPMCMSHGSSNALYCSVW